MIKNQRSPTGRRQTKPQLHNVRFELLPHQQRELNKIKKSLTGPLYVDSVNFNRTVVI